MLLSFGTIVFYRYRYKPLARGWRASRLVPGCSSRYSEEVSLGWSGWAAEGHGGWPAPKPRFTISCTEEEATHSALPDARVSSGHRWLLRRAMLSGWLWLGWRSPPEQLSRRPLRPSRGHISPPEGLLGPPPNAHADCICVRDRGALRSRCHTCHKWGRRVRWQGPFGPRMRRCGD